jgi:hypothetical protein
VSFTAKDFREPKAHLETYGQIKTHSHGAVIMYEVPQPHPLHLTHLVRLKLTDKDSGSASAHVHVTIDSIAPDSDGPCPRILTSAARTVIFTQAALIPRRALTKASPCPPQLVANKLALASRHEYFRTGLIGGDQCGRHIDFLAV